ncbi:DUF3144 domain-containing protein [Leptospira venezuelensis]|uniref:DUF3144 domain-containing protein n=1 Tax=Leptospira dzoumogneensis TaxID=2484904 RepID=A0A4Z1AYQ4_9LEPT|nr:MULTISPECIES: DUF3144 domain-containing protein [Leptospira]TGN02986.1 DUF3144 domain-containing protein [Leptospira dzoumogneensis]
MDEIDSEFFKRADEHIGLANRQIEAGLGRGKVSASLLYSAARFNAWVAACAASDEQDLSNDKPEILEYFVEEYKKMLTENIDDYINNFNKYMKS